jgi:RecB family exonuclease
MQLLTGPTGSGKTFTVLQALRGALQGKDGGVRLLVPTATMAQHLRNELARQSLVFSPSAIQTLSRFIEPWAADLPQASEPVLHMLVEKTVRRLNPPEFVKVAHLAGFHARLAAAIEECSAAGCDAAGLRASLPAGGLGRALAGVFEAVSQALAERKLGLRSTRLALAAARIEEGGTGPVKTIWLDGFFSLTDPELSLVKAMARHAAVTVTLPSADIAAVTRVRLLATGADERVLIRDRALSGRELFVAPGIEREADEIARRILEEAAGGRLFREIGIIVRTPEVYAPLLRATLERFGIPARFYFDSVLMEQPAVRYLAGAVDAMLAGWDHEQTLGVMKLAPGVGISAPMDRFDFELRKKLPGAGLQPLRQLAAGIQTEDRRLSGLLDRFAELEGWQSLTLKPAEWCGQIAKLRTLYRPPRPRDAVTHETAIGWRSHAQSLDVFEAAASEAERSFDPQTKLPLSEFWTAMKAALRLMPLRLTDRRRDVVHVLSAYEARQWELPVVFLCGLVEGQFPRYHPPDPFLPEHARRRLKEHGLRIRTAEDAGREERFLFDSALSRATASLVMSYPKNDARGEQNLPSLFLNPSENITPSRPVRVQLDDVEAAAPSSAIRAADLLRLLHEKHAEVRPTALESYLQCPFQFFGRHSLRLEGPPPRPEDRLDFRACGNIVHKAIAEWVATRGGIGEIFERIFREVAQAESIPSGYKTELLRAQMLADLVRFARTDSWPADHESQGEVACQFQLDGGLGIRCRIDRLIRTPDGRAFVIDYKYSKKKAREYMSNQNLLQGPLYWLAAERGFNLRTAGMYYCGLRDGVEYGGWGERPGWLDKPAIDPFTPEWIEAAIERSVRAAQEITAGRTVPAPSDLSKCRYCDFKDVCRFEAAGAASAEGA